MAGVHWVVCQGPVSVIIILNTLLCKHCLALHPRKNLISSGLREGIRVCYMLCLSVWFFSRPLPWDRDTNMAPKAVLECTYTIERRGNVKNAPAGRNAARNARAAGGWQEQNKTI